MLDALSGIISTRRSKPLSIVVAALALFAPASLTIFLARPELFSTLGVHGVVLLSVGISVPILLLCYSIWWTPLSAVLRILRTLQGQRPETDFLRIAPSEDPLEWPCLLAGAWSAHVVMFVIAVVAYFRPIDVGATFLFAAGILLAIWLLVLIAFFAFDAGVRRKLMGKLEEHLSAAAAAAEDSDAPRRPLGI